MEGRYPRLGRYLFWGRDIEEDDCMEMCVKCDVCKDWRGVKEGKIGSRSIINDNA